MLTAAEIRKMVCRGAGGDKDYKADKHGAHIVIDPWDEWHLNPNSYDLTLSKNMRWYPGKAELDVRKEPLCSAHVIIPDGGFVLEPDELYLGCTNEYTESHNLIPMINGRSSLARLGISVHQTGGFGDIGFRGNWTLEITCIRPVRIYADMKFAQLCWFWPYGEINMTYDGKYQDSKSDDPVGSRISKEFGGSDQ
jgi:dCTP deaminase